MIYEVLRTVNTNPFVSCCRVTNRERLPHGGNTKNGGARSCHGKQQLMLLACLLLVPLIRRQHHFMVGDTGSPERSTPLVRCTTFCPK